MYAMRDSPARWITAQTLELDCLGSNPSYTSSWLDKVGNMAQPLCISVSSSVKW